MARSPAYHRYQLTFNNPIVHGFSHEKIKEILDNGARLAYYCMCDEMGYTTHTYHTHLYVCFSNAVEFTSIQKRFPGVHAEVVAKGSHLQNYDYVRKEGEKYNKDASGEYSYIDKDGNTHKGINYAETFEEWGTLPADNQGHKDNLKALYDLIASGVDNATILQQHPEYLRDLTTIERTRQTMIEKKYRETFRKMDVTYISGPTGCGKTRSVREASGYANCYSISDYTHPFDGYRQQDVIIFDEYRSSLKLGDMLQYLDGYPIELPCRYANKQACYTHVYIISNIPLEQQHRDIQQTSPETWAAFLRRIHRVRIFNARGDYVDHDVDTYLGSPTTWQTALGPTPFDKEVNHNE